MVVFQQDAENRGVFSKFSAGGFHDRGILLVIPLAFQEIKYQPLPMTQPLVFWKAAPLASGEKWQEGFDKVESLWRGGGGLEGRKLSPEIFPSTPIRDKKADWKLLSRLSLFFIWLCHSVWLFHLHSTVKRQSFSPVFPLAESIAEAFFWLFLWHFKK